MRFKANEVGVPVTGVIHVGGHHGEEYEQYVAEGVRHQVWIEPQAKQFAVLQQHLGNRPGVILVNAALGSTESWGTMYTETANGGASSSLLEPKEHLREHPHILFDGREQVRILMLDSLDISFPHYQMLVLDVQGFELEVLKGARTVLGLGHIRVIQAEIARVEVYTDQPMVEDLDRFLAPFGFVRSQTFWYGDPDTANAGEGLWTR